MKRVTRFVLLTTSLVMMFQSCTVQDHLQPAFNPYENCLITRESVLDKVKISVDSELKAGDPFPGGSGKITEIITVDGQKYALGQFPTDYDSYHYDAQKRVVEHVRYTVQAKGADVESFDYSLPNKIVYKRVHEGFPTQTTDLTYEVNADGTVQGTDLTTIPPPNKNLENRKGTNPLTGNFTAEYDYDLTRPNLPQPGPFFSTISQNLLLKSVISYETYTPKKVSTDLLYSFDDQGKVIRKIAINSFDTDKGITVTTYQYECR